MKAQGRQKVYYDQVHCKDREKYKVETLVLIKNSKKLSKKGSKMKPNWTGPYLIHEVLSKGTYRLSKPNRQSTSSKVQHDSFEDILPKRYSDIRHIVQDLHIIIFLNFRPTKRLTPHVRSELYRSLLQLNVPIYQHTIFFHNSTGRCRCRG